MEGSGLVTGREDQGMPQAEPSFKTLLLPQGPLQALMHALKWILKAHFTNKETEARKVQKLGKSAQVRSVAGFETRPTCEPQHLLF